MKFKKIYIEISDICSLNCSFCNTQKEKRGIMPLSLFHKAINEAKKHTKLITLHILGDPLKIINLKEYLDIAKNANLSVEITTSGAFLNDFNILLHQCIKQINISLDAIIELKNADELFLKILDFCDFKIKQNTKSFINLRIQKRLRNKAMLLILQERFQIQLAESMLSKDNHRIKLGNKIIIDFRDIFLWKGNKEATNGTCLALDSHIGILSNGVIIPCCIDVEGSMPLGNIQTISINNAINSNRAKNMLNGFKSGILVESTCKTCDYRKRFQV